jgi:hypothetical protein
MSDRNCSDLVGIAKRNGEFRRNYGILVAAFLLSHGLFVWCDQISTLAKKQLGSYSEHSCAYWHPHGSGKV